MLFKHLFSTIIARSSDCLDTFPDNTVSKFSIEQTHEYDLNESSRYFLHLNSIFTSSSLFHKPTAPDCTFGYSTYSIYSPRNMKEDFAAVMVEPPSERRYYMDANGRNAFALVGDISFSQTMREMSYNASKSDTNVKWILPVDKVLLLASQLFGTLAVKTSCKFNLTKTEKGALQVTLGPLAEGYNMVQIFLPRFLRKALGFHKSQTKKPNAIDGASRAGLDVLTVSGSEVVAAKNAVRHAVFEAAGPSMFYLECDACEPSQLQKSNRKILKIIPIRRVDMTDDNFHYECRSPEHVLIEKNNIKRLSFRLTDENGVTLESAGVNGSTVIVCSIVEE